MTTTYMLDVGGVKLHVVEAGTGRPVVFGHGLLFDHRMYAAQSEALAADHRVVAVDARGHGDSALPAEDWTMRDQGKDYASVMDALEIEQAAVVGHSMGGMAALHLALDYPNRVCALVLIDTSAGPEPLLSRIKYGILVLLARLFGVRPWLLDRASKVMFGATFRRTHPAQVRRWVQPMATIEPNAIARTLRPVMSRPSLIERLHEIETPTLIVVGEEDHTTPVSDSVTMVGRMPNARLVTLSQTGHLAPIEQPAEITRLVRDFLEELSW